jgi:hypothetical protein
VGVENIIFTWVEPYEHGYERCVGKAVVAVDPEHPSNRPIVDLEYAARDRDGLVRFETDVVLLRAPGAGGLLHVVANRGMVTALPYSAGVPLAAATGRIEAGDGWILRQGLSVVWVGWQWDVQRRPGAVGLDVPEALGADGSSIRGQARLGFQPLVDAPRRRLADVVLPFMGQFQALPAADLDDTGAVLTEREWFNGAPREVSRRRWRFADAEHVELDGGFKERTHYELTYTTSRCPVAGAGLAAVRDVVAHLRPEFTHTLAMGISQSGRWLRQFVFDTGNANESGERVFDGIHCHIAGGRRGEFNHRYAQPSTMNALGFTHLPPFSPEDGLLDRARAAGTAPRIVFTNTSTEYWRGDASLSHPVPQGPEWRSYLYAGAHHSGQMPGYVELLPVQMAGNLVDITWPTRAHFHALDCWVTEGAEPPPSAVPCVDDGTAVSREAVLAGLREAGGGLGPASGRRARGPESTGAGSAAEAAHRALGGLTLPAPEALLGMPPLDLGPDAAAGIGRFPPRVLGPSRPCEVSAIDEDGNELAGVRLPHVAVPLDVSFGWNPEQPRPGVPVEVWNLVGGRLPFSVQEVLRRYEDRGGYLFRVRSAADRLVAARHLLPDDVDAVVADAARRWDELIDEVE